MDARFATREIVDAVILRHESAGRYGRLTTMKLQKLLCAAHGILLSMAGSPLLAGEFQAWDDGPVHHEVFGFFRGRRNLSARDAHDEDSVIGAESEAIDAAIRIYGDFSGDALSDISHQAPPWSEAWTLGRNTAIPNASLASHYGSVLNFDQRSHDDDALAEKLLGSLKD